MFFNCYGAVILVVISCVVSISKINGASHSLDVELMIGRLTFSGRALINVQIQYIQRLPSGNGLISATTIDVNVSNGLYLRPVQ